MESSFLWEKGAKSALDMRCSLLLPGLGTGLDSVVIPLHSEGLEQEGTSVAVYSHVHCCDHVLDDIKV